MTVAQVAALLDNMDAPAKLIDDLRSDKRISIIKLVAKWHKRQQELLAEKKRLLQMYRYEENYRQKGFTVIAGVDEAGRGPLAGPVVVGAVILPHDCFLPHLNDSKQLSARQREVLYKEIKEIAIAVHYCVMDREVIDQLNIYQATVSAMYRVLEELETTPQAVLIDAVPLPKLKVPSLSIVGGDAASASIAAASIIAKVERDRIMNEMDELYPVYGFAKHKGYATREHIQALQKYGPCPIHRKSFEPIKSWGG
nr:ribonuclease HII [Propionispora sp. 2/2-37]